MPRLFLIRHGMNGAVKRCSLANFEFRRNRMVSQRVSSKLLFCLLSLISMISPPNMVLCDQETCETTYVIVVIGRALIDWFHGTDWTHWYPPHRTRRRTDHIQTRHPRRRWKYVSRSTFACLSWRTSFQSPSIQRTFVSSSYLLVNALTRLSTYSSEICPKPLTMS